MHVGVALKLGDDAGAQTDVYVAGHVIKPMNGSSATHLVLIADDDGHGGFRNLRSVRPAAFKADIKLQNTAKEASRTITESRVKQLRALVLREKDAVLSVVDLARSRARDRAASAAQVLAAADEVKRQEKLKTRIYRMLNAQQIRALADKHDEPTIDTSKGSTLKAETIAQNLAARVDITEKDVEDFIEMKRRETEDTRRREGEKEREAEEERVAEEERKAKDSTIARLESDLSKCKSDLAKFKSELNKCKSTNLTLGTQRVEAITEKESALEEKKTALEEKEKTAALLADAHAKIKQLETELRRVGDRDHDDRDRGRDDKRGGRDDERGRERSRERDRSRSRSRDRGRHDERGGRHDDRGRERSRSHGRERSRSRGRERSRERGRRDKRGRSPSREREQRVVYVQVPMQFGMPMSGALPHGHGVPVSRAVSPESYGGYPR